MDTEVLVRSRGAESELWENLRIALPGKEREDAREALVKYHTGLVRTIAKKLGRPDSRKWVDHDDLIAAGMVGLVHAINHFDPTKGNQFSTFGWHCIRGLMLRMYLENYLSPKRRLPVWVESDYCNRFANEDAISPLDGALEPERICGRVITKSEVRARRICEELFEYLSREEIWIVKRKFWRGETLEQVGKLMGVTRERVRQRLEYILGKLRIAARLCGYHFSGGERQVVSENLVEF